MLVSLARSNILKKCHLAAATAARAMSTSVTGAVSSPEFDTVGWTEEELDAELESLNISDAPYAIITETEDSYDVKPTHDKKEFAEHCIEFAVYNEFTDHEDDRPYAEALGLDFSKKLALTTGFALTALSNEWYVMNEETIIVAAFIGAITATKAVAGPSLVKWYEEYKEKFLREQNEAEDAHIRGCKKVLEGFPADKIHENLESLFEEEKGVIELEAKARVIQERNELISEFKNNLDKKVVAKSEAANKRYQLILSQTVDALRKEAGKPAFKKKALQYALDAAMNKSTGPDPTVELYDKILKDLSK